MLAPGITVAAAPMAMAAASASALAYNESSIVLGSADNCLPAALPPPRDEFTTELYRDLLRDDFRRVGLDRLFR